jgi:hypothetical protein
MKILHLHAAQCMIKGFINTDVVMKRWDNVSSSGDDRRRIV